MASVERIAERCVVCAIIEDERGRIFLARRAPDQALPGYWEFPGGKTEPGEPLEAALRRELLEELGIHAEIGEEIGRSLIPDSGGVELVALSAVAPEGQPRLTVHDHCLWVPSEKAHELDLAPADIPLLHAFLERQ